MYRSWRCHHLDDPRSLVCQHLHDQSLSQSSRCQHLHDWRWLVIKVSTPLWLEMTGHQGVDTPAAGQRCQLHLDDQSLGCWPWPVRVIKLLTPQWLVRGIEMLTPRWPFIEVSRPPWPVMVIKVLAPPWPVTVNRGVDTLMTVHGGILLPKQWPSEMMPRT
jgi:hypothetical protein